MSDDLLVDAFRQRSLASLLEAERSMREHLASENRTLSDLLARLARRHYGERLEEFRRRNPRSMDEWTAKEWQAFFTNAESAVSPGWGGKLVGAGETPSNGNGKNGNGHHDAGVDVDALKAAIKQELLRELRPAVRLRPRTVEEATLGGTPPDKDEQVAETEEAHRVQSAPSKASKTVSRKKQAVPEGGKTPAHAVPPVISLDGFTLPLVPLRFDDLQERFGGLRWRRAVMILHVIAVYGINALIEIGRHVGKAEGFAPHSNSVKAPFKQLGELGLLHVETLKISHPQRGFALLLGRLTDAGREFCQAVGWQPVESEWERLIRLHEGERQEEHALAVLYFAIMSRARGYAVSVLPETRAGNTPPDVLLERNGERILVEVELGRHDRTAKWKNLQAAQGFAAICTLYPEDRERLAADCKLAHIPGRATDLETLRSVKLSYDMSAEPLWAEEWQ